MSDLLFRDVRLQDMQRLLEIYSYYVENTAISFEYETPGLEEFTERMKNITKKYPYIVVIRDEKIIGYAYGQAFNPRTAYDHCAELTIYLDNDIKKQGVGKALYLEIEKRLKDMGIINLYSCIGYPNEEDEYLTKNSAEFHEHMGFKLCGTFKNSGYKFGRWYSMVWMEKIIGKYK